MAGVSRGGVCSTGRGCPGAEDPIFLPAPWWRRPVSEALCMLIGDKGAQLSLEP